MATRAAARGRASAGRAWIAEDRWPFDRSPAETMLDRRRRDDRRQRAPRNAGRRGGRSVPRGSCVRTFDAREHRDGSPPRRARARSPASACFRRRRSFPRSLAVFRRAHGEARDRGGRRVVRRRPRGAGGLGGSRVDHRNESAGKTGGRERSAKGGADAVRERFAGARRSHERDDDSSRHRLAHGRDFIRYRGRLQCPSRRRLRGGGGPTARLQSAPAGRARMRASANISRAAGAVHGRSPFFVQWNHKRPSRAAVRAAENHHPPARERFLFGLEGRHEADD